MFRLLKCKVKEDPTRLMLDDEADEDQCPTSDHLQQQLREYCANLVAKVGRRKAETGWGRKVGVGVEGTAEEGEEEELSWVDKVSQIGSRMGKV